MESTKYSQLKSTVIIISNFEFKSKVINFLNQIFYYFRHLIFLKKVLKYKLMLIDTLLKQLSLFRALN